MIVSGKNRRLCLQLVFRRLDVLSESGSTRLICGGSLLVWPTSTGYPLKTFRTSFRNSVSRSWLLVRTQGLTPPGCFTPQPTRPSTRSRGFEGSGSRGLPRSRTWPCEMDPIPIFLTFFGAAHHVSRSEWDGSITSGTGKASARGRRHSEWAFVVAPSVGWRLGVSE